MAERDKTGRFKGKNKSQSTKSKPKIRFIMELNLGPEDFAEWSPPRIKSFFKGLQEMLIAAEDRPSLLERIFKELPEYDPAWPEDKRDWWRKAVHHYVKDGEILDEITI